LNITTGNWIQPNLDAAGLEKPMLLVEIIAPDPRAIGEPKNQTSQIDQPAYSTIASVLFRVPCQSGLAQSRLTSPVTPKTG
jgi:hypothetical protein